MSNQLPSLVIGENTSIREVINAFEKSVDDLLLIDERTVVAQPHLELLTDYPRSSTAALVAVQKR
jgi:hypothetical protein